MSASRLVRWAVPLAGTIAFFSPATGVAQDLQIGDRIRVTAPAYPLDREVGRLLSLGSDSLVFESAERRWIVRQDLLTRLEASEGYDRRTGRGVLIGAAVGLVVSLATVEQLTCDHETAKACGLIIAGSTVGGGLLGGVVGSAVRTERWTSIPLGGR